MNDAERKYLAKFIYESDAIENIRDDVDLLERQIAEGKKDGHVGAMLLLESLAQRGNGDSLVNKGLICQIQGLITAEQHLKPGGPRLPKEKVGKYRKTNVLVLNGSGGGRKCPNLESVPTLMNTLLKEIRKWQKGVKNCKSGSNICTVADFHFIFESIHPFADGNGRTGRALVWYLFKYAGIKPFIFTNCDKHETYYLCFEKYEAMRRYFMRKMGFGIRTLPIRHTQGEPAQ